MTALWAEQSCDGCGEPFTFDGWVTAHHVAPLDGEPDGPDQEWRAEHAGHYCEGCCPDLDCTTKEPRR